MGRVHEVLHWANRRAVAEEVTKRGYRVSGETLNRWVRDEKEFPAIVERIVFELFTIAEHEETAPPWAERIEQKVNQIYERQTVIASTASRQVIEALTDPERLEWVERIAAEIQAVSERRSDEESDDPPAAEDRGGAGQTGPGLGSFPFRDSED